MVLITPHSSNLTPHPSLLKPHASLLTPHASNLTPHSSRLTPHASRLTPQTSRLTPHASLLTPHSSRLTPQTRKNFVFLQNIILLIMKKIKYVIYKEGKYYVSQCLNVDISSFGTTIDEAKRITRPK